MDWKSCRGEYLRRWDLSITFRLGETWDASGIRTEMSKMWASCQFVFKLKGTDVSRI